MNAAEQKLLREIQQHQFAVVEANLYLDTHPRDQEAIAYYQKYKQKLREAVAKYEESYGKIRTDADGKFRWAWVDDPWPWQLEG